jgi:hypothetical protein
MYKFNKLREPQITQSQRKQHTGTTIVKLLKVNKKRKILQVAVGNCDFQENRNVLP